MTESGSTSPPSDGQLQRALRPRYSVVDAVLFILLVAAAATFICRQFRRQRDELAAAAFRSPLPAVTLVSPGPSLPDDRAYRHDCGVAEAWVTFSFPWWDCGMDL